MCVREYPQKQENEVNFMCFICKRIEMIKNGENPYFVKELETGYVVIGDHQHFKGYTLFLCKDTGARGQTVAIIMSRVYSQQADSS